MYIIYIVYTETYEIKHNDQKICIKMKKKMEKKVYILN